MALTPEQIEQLGRAVAGGASTRGAARGLGLHPEAARRALAKIKDKVRTAAEFKRLPEFFPQRQQTPSTCWSLERIRNARDAQLRGDFRTPVDLAKVIGTDDAIFTARRNRAAPQSSLSTRLVPANGARGARVASKAGRSVHLSRKVLHTINLTLADHGVAIGYNQHEPSEDGSRVDFRLTPWPLEHVKWNPSTRRLETTVQDGGERIPIVHGDGRWTVFAAYEDAPWACDAALLPAGFVWGAHANGLADWAAASLAHGQAKIVGELPAGVALVTADGALTNEAEAFLSMLQQIVSGDRAAGIVPPGSKTDFLANGSTAWQVFDALTMSREKAAARIYLGTDAILGSVGGAPGIDIAALFAMATTIIQGDLEVIETGLRTGVFEPWCAVNEGDSSYSPTLRYNQPDPDAVAKSQEREENRKRLFDTLDRMAERGMTIDQPVIDQLCREYDIENAPVLAPAAAQSVQIPLAPTDIAKVIRVREARGSAGLPPFGDARDDLTITELDEQNKAKAGASADIAVAEAAPRAAPPAA